MTKEGEMAKTKQRKVIFPFTVINFCRAEEMASFETEFKKAIEELKKDTSTN